jgi:TetR/AcrR family transcriptional regulator, mexJK operon transcriptional repressor
MPDIDVSSLNVRETLILVGEQQMETVLLERRIALARLVAAEAARFPEIGRAYYEHGSARGRTKLEQCFACQVANGLLNIPNVRRAADYFLGDVAASPAPSLQHRTSALSGNDPL